MTATKTPPRFKRKARRSNKTPKTKPTAIKSEGIGDQTPSKATATAAARPQRATCPVALPSPAAILPRSFFEIDALDLSPRLLGKFLRRDDVVLQITEVEAYRTNDTACHGRFGVTSRTAPVLLVTVCAVYSFGNYIQYIPLEAVCTVLEWFFWGYRHRISKILLISDDFRGQFGPGGHAYVYLCYGLHMMLNIVADKEGLGAAVLVRSCAPVSGLETIQERRGQKTEKPVLLTGPGKVGQALGISTSWSHHPLYSPGGLEILDGPEPDKILIGPRVGIEYASAEHVSALWRFAIAGSSWISAPKNTLRPP